MVLLTVNIKEATIIPYFSTTMIENQCSHTKFPAFYTSIQYAGLPLNFQRETVAGPNCHLGLKDGTIYGTQGLKHICAIMKYGKSQDITGPHIQDTTEAHKLDTGYGGTLFNFFS